MDPVAEIDAVLFDADGVVQHQGDYLATLATSQRWSEEQVWRFMDDVFAIERPLLTAEADIRVLLEPVVRSHELAVTAEDFLSGWCRDGIAVDDVALGLVRRLRARGIVCGLATNQVTYRANYMLDELGYVGLFDHVFVSCRMGHAKPSRAFFDAAVDRLGLESGRVLFIDDHPDNVDAARAAGLRAAHLPAGADLASLLEGFGL